jgi:hypothetical protein
LSLNTWLRQSENWFDKSLMHPHERRTERLEERPPT